MSHTSNGKDEGGIRPTMQHPLSSLLHALNTDAHAPISCAECRHHLSTLYHVSQTGEPLPAAYQTYAAHLQECAACAAEYDALVAALAEAAAGTLPEPDRIPQFDLSFMDDEADAPAPSAATAASTAASPTALWLKPAAEGVRRLISQVQIALQAQRVHFTAFPAPLEAVAVAGVRFRDELEEARAEVLVIPAPEANLSVHLTVGPVVAGKAALAVKLLTTAPAPAPAQPLAGSRVTLRNGERQLLAGAVTDHEGTTLFEQLPLGHYFIQVRQEPQTWEIPLSVTD